jgi:hypothetical protein
MNNATINLDVEAISDELYNLLLGAFREQAEYDGKDPEKLIFAHWTLTSTLEETA